MTIGYSAFGYRVLVALVTTFGYGTVGTVFAGSEVSTPSLDLTGERPAVEVHVTDEELAAGIPLTKLIEHGRVLFNARFNRLDGLGRPAMTGDGVVRAPRQPAFVRTSGPDAVACVSCHFDPQAGGASDFSSNVFVLAQERDPVVDSVSATDSNERNSMPIVGAGAIELLAREMSAELAAARDAASKAARQAGVPARRELVAKGISFGAVTVHPNGKVDPSEVAGVDWDLVVRPFHQKGATGSLRDFTVTALNHHHGIQAVERFGEGVDADQDGVVNEATIGDVTALTLFQATLGIPGQRLPCSRDERSFVQRGEDLFAGLGCSRCHVPALPLNDPVFVEPGRINPPGTLKYREALSPISVDLTLSGASPRIQRSQEGKIFVRAFTDLKRHNLNDNDFAHFANERVYQGTLTAFTPTSAFTVPPKARPTDQFLTRRLWDVGNTAPYGHRGDLSTLTEAIHYHGGEARAERNAFFALQPQDRAAILRFLKTLQILPEGSTSPVIDCQD